MDDKITPEELQKADNPSNGDSGKDSFDLQGYEFLVTCTQISKERLAKMELKRNYGKVVAFIAGFVPLVLMVLLAWQISTPNSAFMLMEKLPQAILISGCFLSFIVIYTILIKGMFSHAKEDEASPIKEAVDILREYRPGGE